MPSVQAEFIKVLVPRVKYNPVCKFKSTTIHLAYFPEDELALVITVIVQNGVLYGLVVLATGGGLL